MRVTVAVPGSASCSNLWSAQAFTGNALGGDSFRLTNSPSSLTTSVDSGTGQATAFTTQPTNTTVGSTIPVSVALTTACGTGPAGAVVTIAASNNCTVASGCLSGNTATTDGNGIANFSDLTPLAINTPGTYTLTASTPGFSSATSSAFTVYAGEIFCDDPLEALLANPNSLPYGAPGYAEGKRGKYNKDGSEPCVKVNYTFANDILTNDQVDPVLGRRCPAVRRIHLYDVLETAACRSRRMERAPARRGMGPGRKRRTHLCAGTGVHEPQLAGAVRDAGICRWHHCHGHVDLRQHDCGPACGTVPDRDRNGAHAGDRGVGRSFSVHAYRRSRPGRHDGLPRTRSVLAS